MKLLWTERKAPTYSLILVGRNHQVLCGNPLYFATILKQTDSGGGMWGFFALSLSTQPLEL